MSGEGAKVIPFPKAMASTLEALRPARFVTEAEQQATRERIDMGEWKPRLIASGIWQELDDDARVSILTNRCRDEKPLMRVRAWYAKRHPSNPDEQPSGPPWVFLCGPRGVGKTTAAAWVLARQRGVMVTMSTLLADFAAWKRARPDERYASAFERHKRASVFVLDELGMERDRDADTAREAMFALVNARQSRRTDTIVLTNLSREMLIARVREGVYDERTHDRLRGLAVVLGFEGESLRRSLPGGGL